MASTQTMQIANRYLFVGWAVSTSVLRLPERPLYSSQQPLCAALHEISLRI